MELLAFLVSLILTFSTGTLWHCYLPGTLEYILPWALQLCGTVINPGLRNIFTLSSTTLWHCYLPATLKCFGSLSIFGVIYHWHLALELSGTVIYLELWNIFVFELVFTSLLLTLSSRTLWHCYFAKLWNIFVTLSFFWSHYIDI